MQVTRTVLLAGSLFALVLCGCGGEARDKSAPDSRAPERGQAGPVASLPVSAVPARDSVSAHAVTWSVDEVVRRLTSAGMPATVRGPLRESFIDVPGMLLTIPGAEIEVFIYGDAVAAGNDIDRFDTLTVSPRGTRLVWRKPPALTTDNNLVMIVLTDDAAVRARVKSVFNLTDGPHPAGASSASGTP